MPSPRKRHRVDGAPLGRRLPRAQSGIHCFAEKYRRLQDAQSWPGQDVISRVNALANAIVVSPLPGALQVASTSFSVLTWKGDTHLMCVEELRLFMYPCTLRAGGS